MADSILRIFRDGCLTGEHAPALTIADAHQYPIGDKLFEHILTNTIAKIDQDKAQARGLIIVAFNRSPSYYLDLMNRRGLDDAAVKKCVRILDCFSDPLGWKENVSQSESGGKKNENVVIFNDVRDINKLLASIIGIGNGFVGEGGVRFAVAIDLVSSMLRHSSLSSVARLINNLRSNSQISCILWLIHSDLHAPRVLTALEYISSMVASLEPIMRYTNEQRSSRKMLWLDENSHRAKLYVRLKRRNGRVKQLYEELLVEEVGVEFTTMLSEDIVVNKNLLPKVQFNLQLTDKERVDRANVVLPFEHQGNGEDIHIYDGRRSLTGDQKSAYLMHSTAVSENLDNTEKGEIHYIRDSDDEHPDSDEDPDDDLDI